MVGPSSRQLFRAAALIAAALICSSSQAPAQSATLAWDRHSSHTNLSSYILKYGSSSGSYTGQVSVATNLTSATVNNLVPGRSYFFVAVARNNSGVDSDPSNEISYTVPGTVSNTPPVATAATTTTTEDQAKAITLAGTDSDSDPLTYSIVTPPANGTISGTPPNITYTPTANFNGSDSFTFRVNDGLTNSTPATVSITVTAVNDAPTLNAITGLNLAVDAPQQTINLTGITSGAANESQTLSINLTSSNPSVVPTPSLTYNSPNSTGTLLLTPVASATGSSTISVTVNDGQAQNNTITRTFTVSVGASSTQNIFAEAEAGDITAPMISATDVNASGGQYVYSPTDADGSVTISFTTSTASNYTVWCRILSVDSGTDSFYVAVDGGQEDSFTTAANTWSPNWQWVRLNGNTAGNPRILTLGAGAHTIAFRSRESFTYLDALYASSDPNFVPTTTGPNLRPTLNTISNLSINEDAATQTVNLAGITSGSVGEQQTLVLTATSSSTSLIPTPVINYTSPNATGTLTFKPATNASGSATITVTVDDGQSQSNTFTRSFTVTVNAVNDAPTLNALNTINITEDAGDQTVNLSGISSGASNENQTLTITATSSSTSLIPNPTVSYTSPNITGSISFRSVTNASGTATITVTVNDGQAQNNTVIRTFTVNVSGLNDLPTISDIANQTTLESTPTAALPFTIGDNETAAASLTLSAASSNPTLVPTANIVFGGSGASRTVRVTPASTLNGTANITVTVTDAGGATASDTFTLTVTPVNQPPTLNAIGNLTINEDAASQFVSLTGIGTGAGNESDTLVVTATSSNPGLIPNPSVSYTSPNATGALTYTPSANSNGTATITVTVNDGQAQSNLVTRSFTVTVNAVNDAPTLNSLSNLNLTEDAAIQTVNLSGISSGAANESQTLTITATSSSSGLIPNPTVSYISPGATGTLTFKPVTNASGIATITVTVNDGQAQNNTTTRPFTVNVGTVNDLPTISDIANQSINSGSNTAALPFTVGDVETPAANLVVTGTSFNPALVPDANIVFGGSGASRTVRITPVSTGSGSAVITVQVADANGGIATDTFTVDVNFVNQPPTLNTIGNLTISEDAPAQTVNLSGIGSGGEVQTLAVTAISDNPSLIANPSVTYTSPGSTGTLRFSPATNASGNATITVTVNDGQAQNNTVTRAFTVTVNPVNDAPTITDIADQTIAESSPTAVIAFTVADTESSAASLTLSAISSNPTLVPTANIVFGGSGASRTVRVTPASTLNGSAIITVTVTDAGGATVSDTFTLTVTPVNQPPTLNTLANLSLNEEAAQQTVNLAGIGTGAANETDTLTIIATSSNSGLIPDPVVTYTSPATTGSLHFTPVANADGTATITVTVNDGQAQSNLVTRSFTVTVNAVNDAPTLNSLSNLNLTEDAAIQTVNLTGITSGAANESQTLTVTATSSNPGLIPNPSVTYSSPNATGALSLRSVTNANGTSIISVTVNDGQSQNNTITRTFLVSVSGVNDAPTISDIPNQNVNENAVTTAVPFTIGDTESTAASLTLSATSSDETLVPATNIVFGGVGPNRTITVTPAADLSGTATITVLVSDGAGGTATDTFILFVNAVNQPPTLDAISDLTLNEDPGQRIVDLAGISTGAFGELQTLTVTATSSNPSLIPNPAVTYTSPNFAGTLTFTPVANASGAAVLTVTLNDGQSENNTVTRSFTVTVNPVNDSPTISNIPDQSINQNTSTGFLPFTIGDAESPVNTLTLAGNSSDTTIIPNSNIIISGTGSSRTVRVTPAPGKFGSAVITVTVADGTGGVNSDSFVVNVNAVNFPPTLDAPTDIIIVEDTLAQSVNLTGISSGSANESQTLTVTAVSSDPELIPNPVVTYSSPGSNGTLLLEPFTNAFGTATITVTINDGQAQNNTVTRAFTVTINSVNDAPTLNPIANVTLSENSPTHTVGLFGISTGASNELQTLTITATSSNPGLIPDPDVSYFNPNTSGSLALTPAENQSGTATITVEVDDGESENNLIFRTFTVTVVGGNNPPTISDLPDVTIPMNGVASPLYFTITDTETSPDRLIVYATSSNPELVWTNNIVLSGTGNARVSSVITSRGVYGHTVITYTVVDEDGASSSDSFVVNVIPPNTQPTLDPIASLFVDEDSGPHVINLTGISAGATNETQTLIVSAYSNDPSVIGHPTIEYNSPDSTGTLTFTPVTNVSGSATITVTVNDGQSRDYLITRTFGVIVNVQNDAPTISSIPNQITEQNTATPALPFLINDLETPLTSLTLSATSSDPLTVPNGNIALGGSGANRTITVTPATGRSGVVTITIFISDGVLGASTTFQLTVGAGNTPPVVETPAAMLADSYAEAQIPITINDRESRPEDLILTAASFNQAVVPDANITFSGSGSNRTLRCRPIAGKSGSVTINLGVSDGRAITRRSVQLNVQAGTAPKARLSVRRNGQGTVKPELDGQMLTIGQRYTITAVPADDELFYSWSGSVTSHLATVSFVMASNAVLQVTFTNNPYLAMRGSYNGLFHEADEVRQYSSGNFTVTPTDRGSYTGKLKLGAATYSLSGLLDLSRKGTNVITRKGTNSLVVEIDFGGGHSNQVVGRVTDGIWEAPLVGDRATFNSRLNPAPFIGTYTVILPGQDDPADGPQGDGFGTVKVDGNGFLTLAGTLADGTKLSQKVPVSTDGQWPLYVPLYSGAGSVLSWLTITNRPADDINGLLSWIKPASPKTKIHAGGFTNETSVVGSTYLRPASSTNRVLNFSLGEVIVAGGNISSAITNAFALSPNNKVTDLGTNKLKLSLTLSSGLFTGSITDPATGKSSKFSGAMMQKQNAGSGFLLGTNHSARVVLQEQ